MAAPPQAADELDDRIGAARPPAVGGQVQHRAAAAPFTSLGSALIGRRLRARSRARPPRRRARARCRAGRDARSDRCGRSTARRARGGARTVARPRGALSVRVGGAEERRPRGAPSAAARWPTPVSPQTSTSISASRAGRSSGRSRPTRLATGRLRHDRRRRSASLGAPSSTGESPALGEQATELDHSRRSARAWPGRTRRRDGCRFAGRASDAAPASSSRRARLAALGRLGGRRRQRRLPRRRRRAPSARPACRYSSTWCRRGVGTRERLGEQPRAAAGREADPSPGSPVPARPARPRTSWAGARRARRASSAPHPPRAGGPLQARGYVDEDVGQPLADEERRPRPGRPACGPRASAARRGAHAAPPSRCRRASSGAGRSGSSRASSREGSAPRRLAGGELQPHAHHVERPPQRGQPAQPHPVLLGRHQPVGAAAGGQALPDARGPRGSTSGDRETPGSRSASPGIPPGSTEAGGRRDAGEGEQPGAGELRQRDEPHGAGLAALGRPRTWP